MAASTARSYRLTLAAIGRQLDDNARLEDLAAGQLRNALTGAFPDVAPATWNRAAATLGSFAGWSADQGWLPDAERDRLLRLVEHRRVVVDHDRALPYEQLDRLWHRPEVPLREKALWRLLYETAGRAQEVLCLDVDDIDLANKTARTVRKGGDRDMLHFATGTAQLLPRLLRGRGRGPVFLASRPPRADAMPAVLDTDPETGLARLSYRRAAELFTHYAGGATLHQLRHSALTHLAEDGVSLPLLMAKSRHASWRSLERYAQPSQDAVARLTAEHDPARRRTSR
jgi:integrase/recombinase XerC/integrase/recombinase XerD